MRFNDDDQIVASKEKPGRKPQAFIGGRTMVTIINKNEAQLEETTLTVLLELTGNGSNSDRPGVDIVTVLDVTNNMTHGNKLANMKTAMEFLIQKLSPIDRLSVVTFDNGSSRMCPLRQMSKESKEEIGNLVNGLVAGGDQTSNIVAGLTTALEVLNDRRLTSGRVSAIMLLSSGDQSPEMGDATKVSVKDVPVYTFGFGRDHNAKVLNEIAKNSKGGTFSVVDVENTESSNLCLAFSQCLAGLLNVVVQDLKLSVTKVKSDIENVYAGNYPLSKDNSTGSMSVCFGDLYNKEIRKVIVYLLLPAVSNEAGAQVLQITCSYSVEGELFQSPPLFVGVIRTGKSLEQEREKVEIEMIRLKTAQVMKEARIMADKNKLDEAQDLIVKEQNELEDVILTVDQHNPLIEMLKYELLLLLRLMQSQEIYAKKGHSFALASETSHERQRFAARGHVGKLRMFATPRMDAYVDQVRSFDEDPKKTLPTASDEAK